MRVARSKDGGGDLGRSVAVGGWGGGFGGGGGGGVRCVSGEGKKEVNRRNWRDPLSVQMTHYRGTDRRERKT